MTLFCNLFVERPSYLYDYVYQVALIDTFIVNNEDRDVVVVESFWPV